MTCKNCGKEIFASDTGTHHYAHVSGWVTRCRNVDRSPIDFTNGGPIAQPLTESEEITRILKRYEETN